MTGFVYYNEWDKGAAAWLRELIKMGVIADGIVDGRSITEVEPNDIRGFTQCHFFAGIGGWSYALRLASVGDNVPMWTASLPCQPFSVAGLGRGKDDERHLLPHFLELVRQCQPKRIFGEQVEGAIRHGWLDDLQTTMEAENYTVGHCVLGAHSVGSYHQRQRLYWVANAASDRRNERPTDNEWDIERNVTERPDRRTTISGNDDDGVADCQSERLDGGSSAAEQTGRGIVKTGGRMGNSNSDRCESRSETTKAARYGDTADTTGWNAPDWLYCRDNKYRPIKPGLKPLVDGIPRGMVRGGSNGEPVNANETQEARVMRLKGYGNAIVPQVAAEFIRAFMEVVE